MMLAEFPLVVTKDHLLILAHQGAVEYLLLLLLLLLLYFYYIFNGSHNFLFLRYEAHYGMPLGRKKTTKTVCTLYHLLFILCPVGTLCLRRCRTHLDIMPLMTMRIPTLIPQIF